MNNGKPVIARDQINLILRLNEVYKALDSEFTAIKETAKEMLKTGAQQDTGADGVLVLKECQGRINYKEGILKHFGPEALARIEADDTLRGESYESLTPTRVNNKDEAKDFAKAEAEAVVKNIEAMTKAQEQEALANTPIVVVPAVLTIPATSQGPEKTREEGKPDARESGRTGPIWP